VDEATHQINHYPVDNVVCFDHTNPLRTVIYPVDRRYPAFEQLGPVSKHMIPKVPTFLNLKDSNLKHITTTEQRIICL